MDKWNYGESQNRMLCENYCYAYIENHFKRNLSEKTAIKPKTMQEVQSEGKPNRTVKIKHQQ